MLSSALDGWCTETKGSITLLMAGRSGCGSVWWCAGVCASSTLCLAGGMRKAPWFLFVPSYCQRCWQQVVFVPHPASLAMCMSSKADQQNDLLFDMCACDMRSDDDCIVSSQKTRRMRLYNISKHRLMHELEAGQCCGELYAAAFWYFHMLYVQHMLWWSCIELAP